MSKLDKNSLRKAYLERRKELGEAFVAKASAEICANLLSNFDWSGKVVHVFLPMKKFNEPDLWSIIQKLWETENAQVCTSVTHMSENHLSHYELLPSTPLRKNSWGTDEPYEAREIDVSEIDRVLIPLLAYDKKGNRIGYGKGFYDGFLKSCREDVEKIGISFFPPETEIDGVHEADVPLDFCITPAKILEFQRPLQ